MRLRRGACTYAVVGLAYQNEIDDQDRPVYDGLLQILVHHDPFGTESVTLDGLGLPSEAWTTDNWDDLCRMVNALVRADQSYYPPFNPHPARVEDDQIVTLYVHVKDDDPEGLVAKAVERYGLTTEAAQ